LTEYEAIESSPAACIRSDLVGYLAVLAASACWGTSGVFVKFVVGASGISALSLAFWRDLSTFLVLLIGVSLIRRSWLRVRRSDIVWLAAMGASLGILHVVWNLGVLLNGAAVATVQQAAVPAIVTVVAWLIWSETLGWSKIMAIVLTFVGTVFVSGLDVLGNAALSLDGLLVGLGIPVMYAAWTLLGKKVSHNYNSFTILTYGFGFAALVLLPMQVFTPQPFPVPPATFLWFACLVLLPTIAGFSLYVYGLGKLPASVATIMAMSEIFFVAVYAYILLNEWLTITQIFGAALVVGGVLLLSWYRLRDGTNAG
jgi:DME family drug/metabolite transporter